MKSGYVIVSIVAVFFMAGTIYARQNVRLHGTVRDSRTNEPIAKALVSIRDLKIETTTDENGDFEIADVPPGDVELYVTTVGYTEVSVWYELSHCGFPRERREWASAPFRSAQPVKDARLQQARPPREQGVPFRSLAAYPVWRSLEHPGTRQRALDKYAGYDQRLAERQSGLTLPSPSACRNQDRFLANFRKH